ncbi:MAG: hypothetical protein SOZ23_07025 [Methanosphaera sp.]|uniref:hypothetical protein n=1 Tax=Methanosphaera sp. TaxID=2666342 RepID=UPI0025F2F9CF|nr:hypothetical protein [Methanosphaera sp.]MCI5867102.1 hypothetical protein [Methanosphaera sp.]MDD6535192.1 hypothetical protein [Methanosphaera sp.]MDY3956512.1 hypothetical protein [Methanosphaera sp.]
MIKLNKIIPLLMALLFSMTIMGMATAANPNNGYNTPIEDQAAYVPGWVVGGQSHTTTTQVIRVGTEDNTHKNMPYMDVVDVLKDYGLDRMAFEFETYTEGQGEMEISQKMG